MRIVFGALKVPYRKQEMRNLEIALVDGEVDWRQAPLVSRRHVSARSDARLHRGEIICLNGVEQAARGFA